MARIRTIKPEFCSSADTGALSRDARLFFLQLLTEADDSGRMLWLPRRLCGVLYPFDEDVGGPELENWARQCQDRGMVRLYEVEGVRYLAITNWDKHQRINRATPSKLPEPPEVSDECGIGESSPTAHGVLSEDVHRERNREGEQGTGNREQGVPPYGGGEVGKPTTPPADLSKRKAERYREITEDARQAFNAALGKPNGLLASVRLLTDVRVKEVKRCLTVARDICREQYGSERITREFWDDYFGTAAADDFHAGRVPGGPGHEGWAPDFEYLTRPAVMAKLFDRALADEPMPAAGGRP